MSRCVICGNERRSVGQMDEEELRASGMPEPMIRALKAMSDQIRDAMSPPGALGLPPLLDRRRLEFGIPDAAFTRQALFDRVLVYQLPPEEFERGTFGDTKILAPDVTRDREHREAPRGLLVSAGLQALDELRSNGVDLGHVITFLRVAPWRIRIGIIGAQQFDLLVMQSADIVASADLQEALRSGEIEIEQKIVDGTVAHCFKGAGMPVHAETPQEY